MTVLSLDQSIIKHVLKVAGTARETHFSGNFHSSFECKFMLGPGRDNRLNWGGVSLCLKLSTGFEISDHSVMTSAYLSLIGVCQHLVHPLPSLINGH